MHIPDHGVDQVRIDAQAGRSRRLLDHLAQLRLGHRWHQDEPVGGAAGQLDVLGEPAEVVAPHHQHGATEQTVVEHRQQRVDEGGSLPLVRAGRPQLLELVDDQRDQAAVGAGRPVPDLVAIPNLCAVVRVRAAFGLCAAQQRGQFIGRSRPWLDDQDFGSDAVRDAATEQLGHQPRPHDRGLAHPGRPGDHREPRCAKPVCQRADRCAPAMEQAGVRRLVHGEAPVRADSDNRPRRARDAGCRAIDRSGQRQQQVIGLDQDRLLHAGQRWTWIHTQVLHQAGASAPRGGQRVGLPVAAVQREHQPDPPALTERIGGDPRLQLGHQLPVPAEVEVDVDPRLEDRGLQVRQASALALRPAGGPPVLERLAAPVRQGGLELAARREQVALGPGDPPRRRRHLGRPHVNRPRAHRERVRVSPPDHELSRRAPWTLRLQAGTQPNDMRLQGPARRRRRPAVPHVIDEDIYWYGPPGRDEQPAEDGAFLRAGHHHRHRRIRDLDHKGAEDPQEHAPTLDVRLA